MDSLNSLSKQNNLKNILYLNVILFVLLHFIYVITFLFEKEIQIIPHLGVTSNLELILYKPWTILTYMFIHQDVIHLIFNLSILYLSGKIFINYLSDKSFLATYLMGGLFGALLYIISFNTFPVFENLKNGSLAIGASASVLAILFAIVTHVPDFKIHNPFFSNIKLKHVAIIIMIIDILSIPKGNSGGHIAHLGGALYGYMYIKMKKYNINTNYIFDQISNMLSKNKTSLLISRETDYEYNERKINEQKEIDTILDKISESGYASLSDKEKEFLLNQK